MECPYCSSTRSRVTDKRNAPDCVRRRRECLKCKKRFTTYEKIRQSDFYVIKKDNTRELFDKEKLLRGVYKAFEKRPTPKQEIDKAVSEIEEPLRRKGKEVKSSVIGEMIMKKIKKMDNVAYIRFASVYRDFQDVKDFKEEMKHL